MAVYPWSRVWSEAQNLFPTSLQEFCFIHDQYGIGRHDATSGGCYKEDNDNAGSDPHVAFGALIDFACGLKRISLTTNLAGKFSFPGGLADILSE